MEPNTFLVQKINIFSNLTYFTRDILEFSEIIDFNKQANAHTKIEQ